MWVGNMVAAMFAFAAFREGRFIILIGGGAALTFVLRITIGQKLEALAAEES